MLKNFDIYIVRTLLLSMVVVFLCVGLLMAMFGVVDESRGADETRSFISVALAVFLDLPALLSAITSYIVLMGALIGLGTLSQNSEITALRAAGVAPVRLCLPVAAASLLFYAGVFVIAEFVSPNLQNFANSPMVEQSDSNNSETLWYKEENTYSQLRWTDSGAPIHRVRQFQLSDSGKLQSVLYATSGIPNADDNTYRLSGVVETQFPGGELEIKQRDFDVWNLRSRLQSIPQIVKFEPRDLGFQEILRHVAYLRLEERDPTEFLVEFWSRIVRPFAIIGLVLLTVGFVVGPLRETAMGTRIGVGLVVGILLEYFQRMLIPFASLYDIPAVVVVVIPVLAVFAVGIFLIRGIN